MLTSIFIISIINLILNFFILLVFFIKLFPLLTKEKSTKIKNKYKILLDISFSENEQDLVYNTSFILNELNEIAYTFNCEIENFRKNYSQEVEFYIDCTSVELKEIMHQFREKAPKLKIKEICKEN